MSIRYEQAFQPINSSHTSFMMTLTTISSAVILESSGRIWSGPQGRSVRLMESSGVEYFVQFGSSLAEASTAVSMRVLGGVTELFTVAARSTSMYIAIMTNSTQISDVNVTIGYGR